MLEMIVCYVAGTAAGLLAFRGWMKERIVTATLDMLIQENYVRAWVDDDGITQLYKWDERPEMDEETWRRLEAIIEEAQRDIAMEEMINDIVEENDETDDTP